jgi:hypothetical protein
MSEEKFIGKYRATVINNIDPEMRGRLMLIIPDVSSVIPSTWAEACVPLAGPTGPPMGVYMVPPIGAGVWVEFENGDPNYPVWVGCRWGLPSDVPPLALAGLPGLPNIVLSSITQNQIVISDNPLIGITIMSATGASIIINEVGIIIQNGKGAIISMVGPMVDINSTALTVI